MRLVSYTQITSQQLIPSRVEATCERSQASQQTLQQAYSARIQPSRCSKRVDPRSLLYTLANTACSFMTKTGQFFSEFIASTLLMFLIYALKDDGNIGAGNLTPLGLFFIIFGIGACWGWETGYAINLARDFGPRLMSYFLGYGHEVFSAGNYYFWVSWVSDCCVCSC